MGKGIKNMNNKSIDTNIKSNNEVRNKIKTRNMNTISTNEVFVSDEIINKLVAAERERRIEEAIKKFDGLKNELEEILKDEWIKIENKDIYYLKSRNIVVPDLKKFQCSTSDTYYTSYKSDDFINEFEGLEGCLPKNEDLKAIFDVNSPFRDRSNVAIIYNTNYFTCIKENEIKFTHIDSFNFNSIYSFNTSKMTSSLNIPIVRLNDIDKITFNALIELDLKPEKLSDKGIKLFETLSDLYKKKYIKFKEDVILSTESLKQAVLEEKISKINGISFIYEDISHYLNSNKIILTEDTKKIFFDELLNCDKTRADIEPYDIKRLEDPNLGHWDLWNDDDEKNIEKIKITTDTAFVGRNPLVDIKKDGLIGIDFGTKSTIVVYQDGDDNTAPMRVGMGQFSKKIESKHFENPTVMEFINMNDFLDRYSRKEGRPDTLWEDITVSHTAFNSLIASKSDDYYSYFNDLKQWTGDKNRQIKIRDKKGNERLLLSYLDIKEGEFDPIEIYAYYIGLYINNMHNGIYLDYLLSFPVTYEKAVREKIIKSFEKGIKKSLPIEVLHHEDSMNKFRIQQGASEPAAYAICALQEYGFDPEDDEKVFYGIFDFGGGTTDFDFGIWRSADEDKESRYDYVINHFGAGGDQYLGGENLLEMLAFEIFKDNQDKLREDKISFLKPADCKKFAGSEVLISDSQEAKLNIKQLMEKLRPLWERQDGYEKLYESGAIKVNLFDKTGNPKMNYDLSISMEELEKILENRIEKGVKNFFEALKLTFNSEITKDMNNIVIFLAGNSSKSPIVTQLFDKYMAAITTELKNDQDIDETEYFKIYPPLGTKEAIEIQKENGIVLDENDITRPTGKTGVAYGLVEGRQGGVIKIVSDNSATGKSDEIKFNYYIGRNRKKKFKTIIDRNVEYNKWIKFISADAEDFEFYYTNLPEATTNSISIKEISKKSGRISLVDENAHIYMRAVAPSVIEYTVSTDEGIETDDMLSEICTVEL